MENPPIIEQVEKALHQLYSDPTQNDISSAEKWLQLVQQSPQAWTIAWQLLRKEKLEIQNFGALLLQNKIAKYWGELPQDQYEPLKIELFKAILEFSSGPKLILTRLCVAMVMYMFHAIPEVWPNALVSTITTLRTNSALNGGNTIALLELLKILPEEFDRTNNDQFAQRRVLIRQEIMSGRNTVFSILEQLLSNQQLSSTSIKQSVVNCIGSWSIFCPPLPEVRSLVAMMFQSLLFHSEVIPETSEAIVKLLSHEDSYKYPVMLREFLIQLISLSDFINSHLQQEDPDMDVCDSLCCLATNILESNMSLLTDVSEDCAENSEEALEGLQLLLGFTLIPGSYPMNERCSSVTLSFWEAFLDKVASENPSHSRFLLDFYGNIIQSLIEVFPVKCRYPSEEDWNTVWDESEKDDFLKYREDLCDLGESIQRTLHTEYVEHLSVSLNKLLIDQPMPSWQAVESILFLLQGTASNVTDETSVAFRNVLSLFPRMPPHNTLLKTALRLLGYLSDWFREQPDVLQAVLPMILNGLSEPSVAASASLAFRDVCGDCSHLLAPYVVEVIPACQMSLSNTEVSVDECIRVIAAVGCVLSTLPLSSLSQPLDSLISSRIETLEQLALQQPSTETHPLVYKEVTILSSLCQHIYPKVTEGQQHPVVLLLLRIWASLKALLSKWIGDTEIVSMICTCLRRALRTTQYHYMPLIEESTQLILQCFNASHHSGLLDAAQELIKQFGCNQACHNYLSSFLQHLLTLCLQLCHHGLTSLDPDLLQALLNLFTQTLLSCPIILVNMDGMILNSLNLGMASLQLPEQLSISASSSLLGTLISLSSSSDVFAKIIFHKGRDLVECLLKGIAGAIDRSQLDHVSNVLFALVQYQVEELSSWLKELLSQEGFPSPHPSHVEKELFKSTILQARGSKTAVKNKVREFSLICRGFHGTMYATETSKPLMNL